MADGAYQGSGTGPLLREFVHRECDGASVWLIRGFVGSLSALPPSLSSLSGSFFLGLPQSSLSAGTPQFPLLLSLLQRCFRPAAGQRFRSRLVRLSFCLLSLSATFNREPTSASRWALSRLPEPITQLELQPSSFALIR